MSRYIDPSVASKGKTIRSNLRLYKDYPLFSLVEFNIWGACNRRCSFCPVSDPEIYANKKEGIGVKDYTRILEDLRNVDFRGTILWSMFSEPLLHTEVFQLAQVTKEVLPNCELHVVSNGDWVRGRDERLNRLYLSGIDRILFSLYDDDEQYNDFAQMKERGGYSDDQFVLRRRYLKNGDYGMTISNRAGLIDSNKYRAEKEAAVYSSETPLKKPCYYPFYQVAIDYNGDVLLCPHDWSKGLVTGNALKESIWEIWKNTHFDSIRKKMMCSDRNFNPCQTCDVHGDIIGQTNFDEFLSFQGSTQV